MKALRKLPTVFKTGAEPTRVVVTPSTLMPRLWATAWQFVREGSSPADSTEAMHAGHVGAFYLHCDDG